MDAPLQLSDTGVGTVQQEVYIPLSEQYYLYFVLKDMPYDRYKNDFRDRMKRYVDGRKIYSAKKIPWRWFLMLKESQEIIASGEGDTFQSANWSYGDTYLLISPVKVDPGVYVFSAEILGSVSDIDFLGSRIVMKMDPKVNTIWQTRFIWVGMIINTYILIPIAFVMIMLIAWNILRRRRVE